MPLKPIFTLGLQSQKRPQWLYRWFLWIRFPIRLFSRSLYCCCSRYVANTYSIPFLRYGRYSYDRESGLFQHSRWSDGFCSLRNHLAATSFLNFHLNLNLPDRWEFHWCVYISSVIRDSRNVNPNVICIDTSGFLLSPLQRTYTRSSEEICVGNRYVTNSAFRRVRRHLVLLILSLIGIFSCFSCLLFCVLFSSLSFFSAKFFSFSQGIKFNHSRNVTLIWMTTYETVEWYFFVCFFVPDLFEVIDESDSTFLWDQSKTIHWRNSSHEQWPSTTSLRWTLLAILMYGWCALSTSS